MAEYLTLYDKDGRDTGFVQLRDETVPARPLWEERGQQTLRGMALQQLYGQYEQAQTPEERRTAALAAQYVRCALEGRELP